ncbi:hypothetical protein D3C80_1601270 [compost metagenome]
MADLPGSGAQGLEQRVMLVVALDIGLTAAQHQAGVRVASPGRQQLWPFAPHAQHGKVLTISPLPQAIEQCTGKTWRTQGTGQFAEVADVRRQRRSLRCTESDHGGHRLIIVVMGRTVETRPYS